MKILVVEDEPKLAAFIKEGLEANYNKVDVALDGAKGKQLSGKNQYDVIVLDVILPHINGVDLCKQIRKDQPQTPVLMLTALGTIEDKLKGFNAGADDYLIKPFEFKELLVRLQALARRSNQNANPLNIMKIADLELDLNEKIVRRGGQEIFLTAKEFSLLEYFMINQGRVLSRPDIAEKVWDIHFDTGTNVVDVYVNLLRRKVDKNFKVKLIHTRVGMGYIFKEE